MTGFAASHVGALTPASNPWTFVGTATLALRHGSRRKTPKRVSLRRMASWHNDGDGTGGGGGESYETYPNLAGFPATGETGVLYVAADTGKLYRWTGSAYVVVSDVPAHAASHADGGTDEITVAQSQVTGLTTDLAAKVSIAQAVNAQTGTTYTLVAGDAGKLVTLSNAGAITLTVPQDSDATIPVGTYVDLMQLGAGQVTVVAGTGATLRVSGLTAKARAQYSRLGVQKVSADTWSLYGDLAAS